MIGFGTASARFFTRAFDFQGRASRAEYWWVQLMIGSVLFGSIITIGSLGDSGQATGVAETLSLLLLVFLVIGVIPGISLAVRRLHDTDRSGFWCLLSLIPFGGIVLLVFYCIGGTRGENRFGRDPHGNINTDIFR